ncbi:MAG: ABC-F family ATP-binding cassette domain-containing protein [Deltaproteobacteria bacterium]|nr:ABC-F family ATP-binding cassette domain-containing protein [Deltaproteobacteria bacterium]
MSLLVLEQASLSFGSREIFSNLNLRIGEGERIGLIGPNGSGKSTLLRILTGEQTLDSGERRPTKGARLGYLPQDILELKGERLLDSVLHTVPGRGDIESRLAQTQEELSAHDDPDEQLRLATVLADITEQLQHFELYYSKQRAEEILAGLGFEAREHQRPISELSGGWKMRAALAGLLFQNPDVLFLDEPTNHLDVPSVHWLEQFMQQLHCALVLICHDRAFLNKQIERVISFEGEGVRFYKGNYETYLTLRESEKEILEARARNREKELRDMQRFVERFRAKATKARQAQSRAKQIKRLQKELEAEPRLQSHQTLSFRFPPTTRTGRDAITLSNISKRFGELELYNSVSKTVHAGDRVAIIGRNGAGKTTLLKIIANELAADSGEVLLGANVELGYYSQHHTEQLDRRSTVLEQVWRVAPDRSETVIRSICGAFLFSGDDVEKAIGVLSGGERARVLLARLLVAPGNVLLMDEPTNHLDLASAEALAEALASYEGTLVFVSHNISFVNRLATKTWEIDAGRLIEYPGNLDDYYMLKERAATTAAEAEMPVAARAPTPSQPARPKESAQERKARKRREAEQRNKQNKLTKTVRQSIGELETRIAELETEQAALEPKLADPELYKDQPKFQKTLQQFERNRTKLSELYARWEHQQEELAAFEESED